MGHNLYTSFHQKKQNQLHIWLPLSIDFFCKGKTKQKRRMDRKLVILYGSQTGTAQDLAEYVWRESKRYHFTGSVVSMDKYNAQELVNEQFVIFVCSTTGQGDEPDNMKSFWKFLLRRSLPNDFLNDLRFGVLGLGDSSYEKFNFVAKRLNKRLQQLGGTMLVPTGLCDDQHDLGPSAVYVDWMNKLWDELIIHAPLPVGLTPLKETSREFRWNVQIIDAANENVKNLESNLYNNYHDAIFDETSFETTVTVSFFLFWYNQVKKRRIK